MSESVADLVRALRARAEAVCRHYLHRGRRSGAYWIIGDVYNTPGRSLYVHLARGKWCDAATGEYGDLLDLIRLNQDLSFRDACAEARALLSLPETKAEPQTRLGSRDTPAIARAIFASAGPVTGTLGQVYLAARGITHIPDTSALRFQPRLAYRLHRKAGFEQWPALIAAVRDTGGRLMGIQRTYLARDGLGKAPLQDSRRALGKLVGGGVRLAGDDAHRLTIGEGLETMLAIKTACPDVSAVAALSARHLAAFEVPSTCTKLLIAADNDQAGLQAARTLLQGVRDTSIWRVAILPSVLGDFNDDLNELGADAVRVRLTAALTALGHQRSG